MVSSYRIASEEGRPLQGPAQNYWIALAQLKKTDVFSRYEGWFTNLRPHLSYCSGYAYDGGVLIQRRPLTTDTVFEACLKRTSAGIRGIPDSSLVEPAIVLTFQKGGIRSYTAEDVQKLLGDEVEVQSTLLCCATLENSQYRGAALPSCYIRLHAETTLDDALDYAKRLESLGCFQLKVTYVSQAGELERCILTL